MQLKNPPEFISFSQLNKFYNCPVCWFMDYMVEGERVPPNEYMIWGSAIHHALDVNFKQKITSRRDMDTDSLVDLFRTYFYDAIYKKKCSRMVNQSGVELLATQGERTLYQFMTQMAPNIMPQHSEMKFMTQLKSIPVKILGYIDLIDEDGVIWDWKCAGTSTWRGWTQKKVDSTAQLTFYSLAFRKEFGVKEAGVGIQVIARLKERTKFITLKSQRDDGQILGLLQALDHMRKCIDTGSFPPNLASNCPLHPFSPHYPLTLK